MTQKDSVAECLEFFTKAYPQSTPKNFRTQLGVHFEEFAEMIAALESASDEDKILFHFIGEGIKGIADHLKSTDGVIGLKDRVDFLDGVCDQMVTAVGLARHANMDVVGAFKEVNRSNLSKFDVNGKPILDNNLKVKKGPNYTKPDLKTFV